MSCAYLSSLTGYYRCDNLGAGSLSSNSVFHACTKHIGVDVHYIRDLYTTKALKAHYIPTEEQLANMFTKALPKTRFHCLCNRLCLGEEDLYPAHGGV